MPAMVGPVMVVIALPTSVPVQHPCPGGEGACSGARYRIPPCLAVGIIWDVLSVPTPGAEAMPSPGRIKARIEAGSGELES